MTALFYPVTQQIKSYFDLNGAPLQSGYVYFGAANQDPRANPIQMYWDIGGTVPAAQPFRTVGGFIVRNGTPANVFAPGDFSSVVLNSQGAVVYSVPNSTDLQLALFVTGVGTAAAIPVADAGGFYNSPKNVENILAQIGDNTGSNGFVTLKRLAAEVTAFLLPTGSMINYAGTTAPTGFVVGSGRTIGNGSSGGTERANADCSALYTLLWNSSTNTELPIQDSTGTPTTRGASASNDFAANKRLPLPDCRGNAMAGKDNMGGTAANRITATLNFDGTIQFKSGGSQSHTLTTAELAAHNHTINITDPQHTHTATDSGHLHSITDVQHNHTVHLGAGASIAGAGSGAVPGADQASSSAFTGISTTNSGTAAVTNSTVSTGITAASVNAGGGTAHTVLQPTIITTVIIKL